MHRTEPKYPNVLHIWQVHTHHLLTSIPGHTLQSASVCYINMKEDRKPTYKIYPNKQNLTKKETLYLILQKNPRAEIVYQRSAGERLHSSCDLKHQRVYLSPCWYRALMVSATKAMSPRYKPLQFCQRGTAFWNREKRMSSPNVRFCVVCNK